MLGGGDHLGAAIMASSSKAPQGVSSGASAAPGVPCEPVSAGSMGFGPSTSAPQSGAEDEECTDLFAVSAEDEQKAAAGGCDLAVLASPCVRV